MANSTAGTIADSIWNILRTSGSSTDIPALQESYVLSRIDKANKKWRRAFQRSGSAPLSFLRETGVDLVAETAINDSSGTTVASTSITVDSQSFPDSAGAAIIWDDNMPDVFGYTSQTSTLFSGVSGLSFAHEDNDPIQPLYKLSTSFQEFRPSDDYGDGVKVNGIPYFFMEGPPRAGYFSKYDDGTSKYLWLPRGLTGSASVLMDRPSETINDTSDLVDVEPDYEDFLTWEVVRILTIPKTGGEITQLYVEAKAEANRILKEALQEKGVGKHVRVRQFRRPVRDPSFFQHVPR